ncbi:NACHT domain-containing protein [Streptomyces sp. NPDC052077]|uniref:NACHT domain-containing protein n=1 Tax=Streptomyces sp. NPDC052077 TaxID=3154757 RepID=UPI00341E9DD9
MPRTGPGEEGSAPPGAFRGPLLVTGRTRPTGLICLALTLTGLAGAVWAAHGRGPGAAESAATLLPALAGLYLAWEGFRADRAEASEDRGLAECADRLAVTVRNQWEAEANLRRLYDPHPLPVSWVPAGPDLTEDWPRLRAIAEDWPGGPPADPRGWAEGPGGLAGTGADIADVLLRRTPTRRLVVLGAPGSGKTMLMVRLLLAVVASREPGGAVPVLFPLASWNPAAQSLPAWLAQQLTRDYAGLRGPAPASMGRMNRAEALLEHRLVLPVLDGLDELPPGARAVALDAVGRALPPGQAVVVSSRVDEYRQALRPPAGVPARLAGAAGIELLPQTAADTAAHLCRDAGGGRGAAARWEPVLTRLGPGTPVGRALATPLMVFLARTVYNPRPGEHPAGLPDPAELCDEERLPTGAAVERHLFDAFVPALYRHRPGEAGRWSPERAERALVHLAGHLEHTLGGTPDLAWWQLHAALSRRAHRAFLAATAAFTAGLGALSAGPTVGAGAGLAAGLLGWRTGGSPRRLPAVAFQWSGAGFALGLAWALGFGLFLVLAARTGPVPGLVAALLLGPATGVWLGRGVVLLAGRETRSPDLALAVGPATLLRRDRRVFGRLLAEFAFGYGLVPALALPALFGGAGTDPAAMAAALLLVPAFGLCGAFAYASWGHFALARCHLAARRRLPRDLMAFLEDAHRRGVLRQAGAVYQFRHIDLQHHLADR